MFVMKNITRDKMADWSCVRNVRYKGVECVSKRSNSAICVEENVFVNLPTGYGKSLITWAEPKVLLKGAVSWEIDGRYHDFWPKFTKFKL